MMRYLLALCVALFGVSFLVSACGSGQPPTPALIPTSTQAHISVTTSTAVWTPTIIPTSPPVPTATPTDTSTPVPTATATPDPTLTNTPTQTPVDPAAESTVKLLKEAFAQADIRGFEQLAYTNVVIYGLYDSDMWVKNFSKAEFLAEIKLRLSSHPQCAGYSYRSDGMHAILWIFTSGWDPGWQIASDTFPNMVFELQSSGRKDLYLIGAYPNPWQAEDADAPCP